MAGSAQPLAFLFDEEEFSAADADGASIVRGGGGGAPAATKTMTARQMEALK
jgi:DUF917 family protein